MKFLAFFLLPFGVSAQLTADWAFGLGFEVVSVEVDLSGNLYAAGSFQFPTDFDPSSDTFWLYPAPLSSTYLARYNVEGALDWTVELPMRGSGSTPFQPALSTDLAGYSVAGGYFYTNSPLQTDGRLVKYTPDGIQAWSFAIGGSKNDEVQEVLIAPDGHVYALGVFRGTAEFDPSPAEFTLTSTENSNLFLAKYTAEGQLVWARQFSGMEYGSGLAMAPDGNLWLIASWNGTAILDPEDQNISISSSGSLDGLLMKVDPEGSILYYLQFKNAGTIWLHSLAVDTFGNVFVSGRFDDEWTTEPPSPNLSLPSNEGIMDGFVAKTDTAGSILWVRKIGGSGYDEAFGLAIDHNGSVFVGGNFQQTVDFDPAPLDTVLKTSAGVYDPYIVRFSPDGKLLDIFTAGGPGSDVTHDLALSNQHLFWGGFIHSTVDFNPLVPAALIENGSDQVLGALVRFNYRTYTGVPQDGKADELPHINIFPNPVRAGDIIHLTELFDNQQCVWAECRNATGKKMYSIEMDPVTKRLPAPAVPDLYCLLFYSENGRLIGIGKFVAF